MIQAIAVDDEPFALKIIEGYCQQIEGISLEKTFTKPTEALKYLKRFPVDLIFLDVEMPSLSGIEFYKEVKQTTMVIFTTAHMEYAVEGFNLNALDFLLKPYSLERFQQAVNKAQEYVQWQQKTPNTQNAHIFIRADYSLLKVAITDIIYIESFRDYLKIHLNTGKYIITRMTMKSIVEKLPSDDFIRVHKSFIVPLQLISSIRNKSIYINQIEIPIGKSYEEDFFKVFKG